MVGQLPSTPYTIVRAGTQHLQALPAIERAAAQLLAGHAPEAVLHETPDVPTFAGAADRGLLWVALGRQHAVGFALVRMLAADLPHLED